MYIDSLERAKLSRAARETSNHEEAQALRSESSSRRRQNREFEKGYLKEQKELAKEDRLRAQERHQLVFYQLLETNSKTGEKIRSSKVMVSPRQKMNHNDEERQRQRAHAKERRAEKAEHQARIRAMLDLKRETGQVVREEKATLMRSLSEERESELLRRRELHDSAHRERSAPRRHDGPSSAVQNKSADQQVHE
jgi:hypothetical protein